MKSVHNRKACCKCENLVDEHHVMCDPCFTELREQAFNRLLQVDNSAGLPKSIRGLRERLQANFFEVEKDPAVEALRTNAGKYFLAADYPDRYRFKE